MMNDRPRQETVGPFMSIDKGSNQLHYMKPPYAKHVQLSLDRGARSGMDTCSRRTATSTSTLPSIEPTATADARRPRTAPTSIAPAKKNLALMAPHSMERGTKVARARRGKIDTSAAPEDRPRQEKVMPFMSIDKGSNQVHYMKPPYAKHVQLSLDRGARSGMESRSRLRGRLDR